MFEELGETWGLRKEEGREDLLKVLKVEKVSRLEVLDTDKECLWWSGRHKVDFQHSEIDGDEDKWQWFDNWQSQFDNDNWSTQWN